MNKHVFALIAILYFAHASAQVERVINVPTSTSSSSNIQALLHLPSDYTISTNTYPLIIFCHSASEAVDGASAGTGLAKIYNQALYGGPPYFIEHGAWPASFRNPLSGMQEQFIVVSPQSKHWQISGDQLAFVIDYIVATYRVDVNRIHITGVSAGGGTIVQYAAHLDVNENTPSLTSRVRKWKAAGMLPMSDALNNSSPKQIWGDIIAADSIMFWGFGDLNETHGGITNQIYNFVNKAKPGTARFTAFTTGHGPWNPFYNPSRTETFTWKSVSSSYSIYNWMLANSRTPATPAANAGLTQTIALPTTQVTLNGSGSTGVITSYNWTQVSGPSAANITTASLASTTVTGLEVGTYIFKLTINGNNSSSVVVTVNPEPPPPIANAGITQSISLPTKQVTLNGSSSTGVITSYAWTQVSGPAAATLATPTSVSTTAGNLVLGEYIFQLALNGGSVSTVKITVNPPPPVANAGSAQTITPPTNQVTLSGSGSTGVITSYLWSKVSGPTSGTIVTRDSVRTIVTGLVPGTYVFRLTLNASSSATVTITVNAIPALVAKAGSAQKITLPTNQVTLNGSTSTGIIASYQWTQLSGPPSDTIESPLSAVTNVKALVSGNYIFQLKVIDTAGKNSTSNVAVMVLTTSTYTSPVARIDSPSQNITTLSGFVTEKVSFTLTGSSLYGVKWTKFKTPGQTTKTVVFVGSSTVAAVGATTTDSSLVGRFTKYYTAQGMIKTVINLGRSGSNPYNAMPTGYIAPASVTTALGATAAAIDPAYNITKALSYNPDIIVISFPTYGYNVLSTTDIMKGLQILYDAAIQNGADCYISTTQPREDFTTTVQTQLQTIRDSILLRFGTHAINFYDAIVIPSNNKRLYPFSSDAINVNNQGHLQLFNVLVGTNVFQNKISSNAVIANSNSSIASINNLEAGTHQFQASVTDTHGQKANQLATVTVIEIVNPIANAGPSQTILPPANSIRLSGSSSTGPISSYSWVQVSGPGSATIDSPLLVSTNVTGLVAGTYIFKLTLNGGSSDTLSVTVLPAIPPVVNPVAKQPTITLPINNITLNGTSSTGTIYTFSWTQVSGPNPASILSPDSSITEVKNLIEGVYQFKLTLNGDSSAIVQITVIKPPLIANAGAAQSITLPVNQVVLNGTASAGIINSYAWSQVSGPDSASILSSDSSITEVKNLTEGVYQFKLTLNGDSSAIVQITVIKPPLIANAGAAQSITLPVNQVVLNGTASSGIINNYAWSQVSGPGSASILSPDSSITEVKNLTEGVYQFKLTLNGDSSSVVQITVIKPPLIANAGAAQSITLPVNQVVLNGTASAGIINSYAWSQVSGPDSAILLTPSDSVTVVKGLKKGVYQFKLTLNGDSAATVNVTVIEPPLIANAGAAQSITLPVNQVLLNGTASAGIINSYAWSQVSGPDSAILLTPSDSVTVVKGLKKGVYQFKLTLNGDSAATVNVTVIEPPLIANAGAAQSITLPVNQVLLNGTASAGIINSYAWSQVSGPDLAFLLTPSDSITVVKGLKKGVYQFKLTLNGDSAATVNVTVIEPPLIANAGAAQSITLPVNQVLLNGTASAGIINSYAWSQVSGPDLAFLLTPSDSITVVKGLKKGVYQFKLTLNGDSAATVNVTVIEPPLIANAGAAQSITLPVNQVLLNGTASAGIINSYAWSQVSGPDSAILLTPSDSVTVVKGLKKGVYQFKLTLNGDSAATVNVTVIEPPLIVNAGPSQSITQPTSQVILNGGSSSGLILFYKWQMVSGPSVPVFAKDTAVSTLVTGLIPGNYIFRLSVTDYLNRVTSDTMTVTVISLITTKLINVNIFGGVNAYNNTQWNNWDVVSSLNSPVYLYTDRTSSGVSGSLNISDRLVDNGTAYGGGVIPAEVLRFASYATQTRTLTLKGLKPNLTYNLELYASRDYTGQKTIFQIAGQTAITVLTHLNKSSKASFTNLKASADGRIVITISTTTIYNYLNGFALTEITGAPNETLMAARNTEQLQLATAANDSKDETLNENQLKLNPNPVRDQFTVSIKNNLKGKLQVFIANAAGTKLRSFQFEKDQQSGNFNIQISDLPKGIYFVNIKIGEWTVTKKIVKM